MREPDPVSLKFKPAIAAAMLAFGLLGCDRYAPKLDTVAEQDEFTCTQYGYAAGSTRYNDCLRYVASQRGKFGAPSPAPAPAAPATPEPNYVCKTRGSDSTCRPQ